MNATLETTTRTLPAYWASYLINGDASGLQDGEQEFIDAYLEREELPSPCDCSSESWFSWRNDSGNGLGGDVLEFTFFVR